MKDSKKVSLYINSATKALEFALKVGNEYQKIDMGDPKKALERSHLGIQCLLDNYHISLKDVDAFYCLLGPGSNTGIRLGLTIVRTIYAFNEKIKIYGIPTLTLMTLEGDHAVLSDRGGNLFYGKRDNNQIVLEKVLKTQIQEKIPDEMIITEDKDNKAKDVLSIYSTKDVNIVDLMVKHSNSFINFSDKEEEFLPEYLSKI